MPPKKADSNSVTSEQMEAVLSKLEAISERLESVESLLTAAQAENAELKAANTELHKSILDKNSLINSMRQKLNSLEQYNRSWSIRLSGVPVPDEESHDPIKVMQHVYNLALLPILQGAVSKKLLVEVPSCEQLLETAHILPAKSDNKPKPIIARFYSRNMRALVFRLKREFAPKTSNNSPPASDKSNPSRLKYPFFEDLTKANFHLLRSLADDSRTGPVWSINGIIKYRLVNGTEVKKVSSVFDSVDDILRSAG